MDTEGLEKLLEKNIALAQDNNRMLKKLYNSMRWGRVLSIIYWALIIGSAFGAYYFLQPFIDEARNIYGDFAHPNSPEIKSLLLKQLEGTKTYTQ
jgi:uncharacterized membrane protein (DUF106 family)